MKNYSFILGDQQPYSLNKTPTSINHK